MGLQSAQEDDTAEMPSFPIPDPAPQDRRVFNQHDERTVIVYPAGATARNFSFLPNIEHERLHDGGRCYAGSMESD
jgi:hypothetical protein